MSSTSRLQKPRIIVGSLGLVLLAVLAVILTLSGSGGSTSTTLPYDPHHNARADVSTNASCNIVNDKWVLEGVIVNSATFARKYQIIVDFVTTSGATVQATSILQVPRVESHATYNWTVSGAKGLINLSCVIRSVLAVRAA